MRFTWKTRSLFNGRFVATSFQTRFTIIEALLKKKYLRINIEAYLDISDMSY